ncbi:TPA: hypothetical protein ACHOT8_005308, partial [Escherichia coli]
KTGVATPMTGTFESLTGLGSDKASPAPEYEKSDIEQLPPSVPENNIPEVCEESVLISEK